MKLTLEIELGTPEIPTVNELTDAIAMAAATVRRNGLQQVSTVRNVDGNCVGRMSVTSDPMGNFDRVSHRS